MASRTKPKPKTKSLPPRSKVKPADKWNLASLFKTDADWERAFKKWEEQIPGYEKFKGQLGDSAEMLAACLQFDARSTARASGSASTRSSRPPRTRATATTSG